MTTTLTPITGAVARLRDAADLDGELTPEVARAAASCAQLELTDGGRS